MGDMRSAQAFLLQRFQQYALIGDATAIADMLGNLQGHTASGISSEGASTQWLLEIPAHIAAQMCEAALQRIAADDAAGGDGMAPGGNVRGIDFSCRPCVMG